MNVIEEPPPSKRVRTVADEGVEQLQPTAMDSEETNTTGEVVCCGVQYFHYMSGSDHTHT